MGGWGGGVGIRPGAGVRDTGRRGADGERGWGSPPARRELTPAMSLPGCRLPFPTVGARLQLEREEGGGGGGEEGSPGPAAWLVSPIF